MNLRKIQVYISEYNGFPTYVISISAVHSCAIICQFTRKWGNLLLIEVLLQSHLREFLHLYSISILVS